MALIEALAWKFPGVPMVVSGDEVKEWGGSLPMPDLKALMKEHEVYLKTVEYRPKRANEYPSIGDQLDAIWRFFDSMDLSSAPKEFMDVYNAIKAIKDKYPKPADAPIKAGKTK